MSYPKIPITLSTNEVILKATVQEKLDAFLAEFKLIDSNREDLESMLSDLSDILRENEEVKAGKVTRLMPCNEDIEINLDMGDFFEAVDSASEEQEILDYCLENFDDDYFYDHLIEQGDSRVKPLLASDFNDYNFRRKMCDLFEVGYHTDTLDLIKLYIQQVDKDLLFIL